MVFRRFCIAFLSFFGVYLLYFNLCLVLNITPFPGFLIPSSSNFWTSDYYFGFSSVLTAIDDFPNSVYLSSMSANLEMFMNSLGNIANIFSNFDYALSNGDILSLFRGIFDIITAPLQALVYFLLITFNILLTIFQFIVYAYRIVSGYYNIPVSSYETDLLSASGVISLSVTNGQVVW